ncbi:hypothetical protein [Melissospora conviva]|uniref:hypothetical protein n=1 Tax=Melissospora conviva TaxID=3388432 RepID=UPI003C2836F9
MSWQLKKSRGLFFARTGEPQVSYWANSAIRSDIERAGAKIPADLLDWDPNAPSSRSNCPVMHGMVEDIAGLVDPRWRARASNIYAGRTFSNDDTAFTGQNVRSGMVAMSSEFSSAVIVYAAMFLTYVTSIDDAKRRTPQEADQILHGMRAELDEAIEKFKVGGLLAVKGTKFMWFPNQSHLDALDLHARYAEEFTIAHEISHHVARDLSSRRDRNVASLLAELRSSSKTLPLVSRLSADQRMELEADLLATLIIAGGFSSQGVDPFRLHLALMGAGAALVTIGHLRDEWTSEPSDEHPGCLTRLYALLMFLSERYGKASVLPNEGGVPTMPLARVAGFWMSFAHWAEGFHEAADELSRIRRADRNYPDSTLLAGHYAAIFGIASEE